MSDKMIQVVETFKTRFGAEEGLRALATQDGYQGGRVLDPGPGKPGFRAQAFFTDDTDGASGLPDGMRRVVVPATLRHMLGLKKEA